MEAWSYAQYAGERERERVKTQKTLLQKILKSTICSTCVCVQCTLIYKSFGGLTEVLSYFNALKERLHKTPKYIPYGISFSASFGSLCRTGISDRSQPTRYSVLGLTDRSPPTRYSASSADGRRLLQPTRPMLSLYLNKKFPFLPDMAEGNFSDIRDRMRSVVSCCDYSRLCRFLQVREPLLMARHMV